jgi:hypothetical protein
MFIPVNAPRMDRLLLFASRLIFSQSMMDPDRNFSGIWPGDWMIGGVWFGIDSVIEKILMDERITLPQIRLVPVLGLF